MGIKAVAQVIYYWAWNVNTNAGQTGDVANHSIHLQLDGVLNEPDNAPSEVANGLYKVTVTIAEATCGILKVYGSSSTSGVRIFGETRDLDLTGDAFADTTNIKTRLPAALVTGRMDSSVGAIVNGAIVAASFAAGALDAVWSTSVRSLTSFGTLIADIMTQIAAVFGAGPYTRNTEPPTAAAIAIEVETAMLNEADGRQLLANISAQVQALFDEGTDVPVAVLIDLINDEITTRHGSGSYITNTEPDNTTIASISTALTTLAGKFTGITLLANWLRALMRKDTPDPTALTEINVGGGGYNAITDSNEALRDRGDSGAWAGVTPIGAGAIEWEVEITDDDDNPIDGVEVWVSTDSVGSNVVAGSLTTDAFGIVIFMLDAGNYYLWKQHANYNFTNPVPMTVA